MHTIYPNGRTKKVEVEQRLDRVDRLLKMHREKAIPLRVMCANHLADALGCLAKCLLEKADNALDEAEKSAETTTPEPAKRLPGFTQSDLEAIVHSQRASLPKDAGHPMQGWLS